MSDSSIPPDPTDEQVIEDFLGSIPTTPPPEPEPEPEPTEFLSDNIESGFEDATTQIGDGSCRVCGTPTFRPPGLTPTGRKKRAPRYCDIHDPKRRVSHEGPSFAGMESQLQRIQEELADEVKLLGTLAGPMLPVTGYFVFTNADAFTIALLRLFKNQQSVLRILHRAAQIAPIYTVAEVVAGTAYSVQVDTNKADPHNTIGQRLGVSRAYDAVYPDQNVAQPSPNGFQGPPKYAAAS